MIEEIADLLQTNGIGTVGTNIFIGELPETPENCIMLLGQRSEPQEMYYDIRYAIIDIWVRNKSFANGNSIAQSIFDLLHRKANYDTTTYTVYFSHAISNIDDYDKDINGRKLQKLSLRFIYRLKNPIS